jgi:hypothetical protein
VGNSVLVGIASAPGHPRQFEALNMLWRSDSLRDQREAFPHLLSIEKDSKNKKSGVALSMLWCSRENHNAPADKAAEYIQIKHILML